MNMLSPSIHVDTFARDHLPPVAQQPDYLLDGFDYPLHLNAGFELTDAMVDRGFGDSTALIGNGRLRTYKELTDWTNRLAHVLVDDLGVQPGNRVLIRSANNPAMVACWLAATKVGAVVVNTMPMLRAVELAKYVDKAEIQFALCDPRLMDEMTLCAGQSRYLSKMVGFDGTSNHDAELDRLALEKPVKFACAKTGRDDVALLGFTSGSTGEPKATMHFHRDLLIIANGYAREILNVQPDDVFVGSPPLAFTFGLGGLAVFPLRFGATATLLEQASPAGMIEIIEKYKATVCFTAPTAYRVMLRAMQEGADLSSLRAAVSAGETLPKPIYDDQAGYVVGGWNITGDSFLKDVDGYFHFAARNDDMIVSAGYNIAGPEVEAALLAHDAVSECAVIAAPDPARGHIVEAHIVLSDGCLASEDMKDVLKTHVKSVIAPYKYQRAIRFCNALPKTPTGKIQRFKLKHETGAVK